MRRAQANFEVEVVELSVEPEQVFLYRIAPYIKFSVSSGQKNVQKV
jgi:hypothetical protein